MRLSNRITAVVRNRDCQGLLKMTTIAKSRHLLPPLLAKPLALIPGRAHATVIAKLLDRLLARQIADGDLDFMTGRNLRVEIMDAGIGFNLAFDGKRLLAAAGQRAPDLVFRGNVHDFLLLAARREDSDTLFFQRRLQIEGDTDMGLEIKNLLDAIDLGSLLNYNLVDPALGRAVQLYERLT
jgi:predicted lipid carrier protein YhbT